MRLPCARISVPSLVGAVAFLLVSPAAYGSAPQLAGRPAAPAAHAAPAADRAAPVAPADRAQVAQAADRAQAGGGRVSYGTPVGLKPNPMFAGAPTYRVYATREGLVGGRTANGHVIVERDHFVALPSWWALALVGRGDFSVRVCSAEVDGPSTGRCVYEPVWDVGPWNTHDDYWNRNRENWPGLPVGTPQAAAAFLNGYNGGLDQYGRQVLNPAGIDLADGAFWDGLGFPGGSLWVDVTFLWLAEGPFATVYTATGQPVRLRGGPGTGYRVLGEAASGARIPVQCQVPGTCVSGAIRSTNLWDRIGPGQYVSHAYLNVDPGTTFRRC